MLRELGHEIVVFIADAWREDRQTNVLLAADIIKGFLVLLGWTVLGYLSTLPPGITEYRRHLLEEVHFWVSAAFIVGFAILFVLEVVVIRIDRIRNRKER